MTAFRDRHPHLTLVAVVLVAATCLGSCARQDPEPGSVPSCGKDALVVELEEIMAVPRMADRAPLLRGVFERCGNTPAVAEAIREIDGAS